jgi:hypothetical protein
MTEALVWLQLDFSGLQQCICCSCLPAQSRLQAPAQRLLFRHGAQHLLLTQVQQLWLQLGRIRCFCCCLLELEQAEAARIAWSLSAAPAAAVGRLRGSWTERYAT